MNELRGDSERPMSAPAPVARPPQFSLQHLLVVISIVAVWLGVLAAGGTDFLVWMIPFLIIPVLLDVWLFGRNLRFALGHSIAGAIIGFLILAKFSSGGGGYNRVGVCGNNLRFISIALSVYEAEHGCYPPVTTFSESGRPMHSWRTLILSQIERDDLRKVYDFNQPWNGPTNKQLHGQQIKLFQCLSDPGSKQADVSYLAVVGPTAKPGDRFAVIEVPKSGINFFEPRDITLDELQTRQTPAGRPIVPPHYDQTELYFMLPGAREERITLDELPAKLKAINASSRRN